MQYQDTKIAKRMHSAAKPFLAHSPLVTVQASEGTQELHSLSPIPPGMVPRTPKALASKARHLELRLRMEVSCFGSQAAGFAGKQDPGELPPQQRWYPHCLSLQAQRPRKRLATRPHLKPFDFILPPPPCKSLTVWSPKVTTVV